MCYFHLWIRLWGSHRWIFRLLFPKVGVVSYALASQRGLHIQLLHHLLSFQDLLDQFHASSQRIVSRILSRDYLEYKNRIHSTKMIHRKERMWYYEKNSTRDVSACALTHILSRTNHCKWDTPSFLLDLHSPSILILRNFYHIFQRIFWVFQVNAVRNACNLSLAPPQSQLIHSLNQQLWRIFLSHCKCRLLRWC